jgi:hypothetical protein
MIRAVAQMVRDDVKILRLPVSSRSVMLGGVMVAPRRSAHSAVVS